MSKTPGCPKCGHNDIRVSVETWADVAFYADGDHDCESADADLEFDGGSTAQCRACGWFGHVNDITPQKQYFTVFIRQANDQGTTWISEVWAESIDAAKEVAKAKCAADWGWDDTDDLAVIGVVKGNAVILEWKDLT